MFSWYRGPTHVAALSPFLPPESNMDAPTLTLEQEKQLRVLFDVLDVEKSGKLGIKAMQVLGQAMTGLKPTKNEALEKLKMADKDRDEALSIEEWLSFSKVLANLPAAVFNKQIGGYIEAAKGIAKKRAPKEI